MLAKPNSSNPFFYMYKRKVVFYIYIYISSVCSIIWSACMLIKVTFFNAFFKKKSLEYWSQDLN
jgi:hypothetical protein